MLYRLSQHILFNFTGEFLKLFLHVSGGMGRKSLD